MRLDAAKMGLPAEVLAVDFAEVGYEKGILVARAAGVRVDRLDARAEGVADQLASMERAMVAGVAAQESGLVEADVGKIVGERQDRRCHSPGARSWDAREQRQQGHGRGLRGA